MVATPCPFSPISDSLVVEPTFSSSVRFFGGETVAKKEKKRTLGWTGGAIGRHKVFLLRTDQPRIGHSVFHPRPSESIKMDLQISYSGNRAVGWEKGALWLVGTDRTFDPDRHLFL